MTATIPLNPTRINDIASAIRNACAPIVDADLSTKEARELTKNLQEQGLGVREQIMANVASLAVTGNWDAREVEAGAKAAADMGNDLSDKSMATFIGQVKLAAMPLVRDQFKELTTVVNDAWQAEGEQLAIDKASPAPLRKAWKRRFHTLVHVFKVVAKSEQAFANTTDLITYAYNCDPDHDAGKIEKRIEALVKQINDMVVDFPHDDLKLAGEYLGTIDVKSLQAARQKKLEAIGGDRPLVATPKPPKPTVVAKAEPAEDKTTIVNDAAIDDLLGDNLAAAA